MAAVDPIRARFPGVARRAGHYESYYLKLCHPERPLGAWIRYTVHKRPKAAPAGSLWLTLFDAEAAGPRAAKLTVAGPSAEGRDWIRIAESSVREGRARGTIGSDVAWELAFDSAEPPLSHLPAAWMYTAPLPRTKLLSPVPAARFSGRIAVDGRELEVDGWRGMIGHNWGAEHAERWIWLHGLGFEGAGEETWLDAALGKVRVGPLTTPWIANGALSLDGERLRLGGPGRRIEVRESPDACEFAIPGAGVKVRGSVSAARKDVVGWVYADPDGPEHHTANCSIADMRLTVERDGRPPLSLALRGGAAYELGMRERDHGVPIQPFADG